MRTESYIGTTDRSNMDRIEELREEVRDMFGTAVEVKIRGRLGYNNPARYRDRYAVHGRHQMILHEDASRFDIYVYRRDWTVPNATVASARKWAKEVWELLSK